MYCPNCGSDNQDGSFCNECGMRMPTGSRESVPEPGPAPVEAQVVEGVPQSAPAPDQAVAPQPNRKRGCGCIVLGCLGTLVLVTLVIVALLGWYLRWYEQWGLVESPAQEFLSATQNPWAREFIEEELAEEGVAPEGVTVYVMTKDEGTAHTAYVLVEEANGFSWSHPAYPNPMEGLLVLVAGTEAAEAFDIDRVAVDYRDAEGTQVAVMTAPTQALVDFAAGDITREQLFEQMNARTPDMSPVTVGGGE